MDLKYWALIALFGGIALVITGFATMGDDSADLDRLPFTILLIVGGALFALAGLAYMLVQLFLHALN